MKSSRPIDSVFGSSYNKSDLKHDGVFGAGERSIV